MAQPTAAATPKASSAGQQSNNVVITAAGIVGIRATFPRSPQTGKMLAMAQPILRPQGAPKPRVPTLLMRVWDAPTRLFHWSIVILIAVSYFSMKFDYVQVHYLSGYTMLALLLFRLCWGLFGSETSRFRQFMRSPVEAFQHLASFTKREPDREIGHNAAGGWMVLLMLLVLAVQAISGLFAGDPVEGGGPFVDQIARAPQRLLNNVHAINFNIIIAVMVLHVAAILAYAAIKRHDLVRPMITGKKRLPATARQPRFASPALAALFLAGAGLFVWLLVRFA